MMKRKYAAGIILLISMLLCSCGSRDNATTQANKVSNSPLDTASPKGGEGTGMFEYPKAENIVIEANNKSYEITGDQMQKLIELCKSNDWDTIDNKEAGNQVYDICINFNTNRAKLYINKDNHYGMLNETCVSIPDSIYDYTLELINK